MQQIDSSHQLAAVGPALHKPGRMHVLVGSLTGKPLTVTLHGLSGKPVAIQLLGSTKRGVQRSSATASPHYDVMPIRAL